MTGLGSRYVWGKAAGALGSLAFMLVFNFFLFRVLPGDPVRTLARNRLVSEKQMDELTRTLGLDQPLPVQFVTYLKNTFTGEFGLSFKYRVPVADLIVDRLWPTLLLVGTGTLLMDHARDHFFAAARFPADVNGGLAARQFRDFGTYVSHTCRVAE